MERNTQNSQAYRPPSAKQIASKQNTIEALRLLLAQRRLYNVAKRWAYLRLAGIAIIAIAAPITTVIYPHAAVIVGAAAAGWVFLARTVFFTSERKRSAEAAEVQEQFDLHVFGMPEIASREPIVAPEEISDLTGNNDSVAASASLEDLRDWYPVPNNVPGRYVIAIAQRANAAYTARLSKVNANIWLFATLLWCAISIAVGCILRLAFSEFLLGVGLPLLPALLDIWEQRRLIVGASAQQRALVTEIESAIHRWDERDVSGERLLLWQNQLYDLRRNAPHVPNMLYKKLRHKNELAMKSGAEELAKVARAYST